jgi:hypothetical protein
MMKKLSRASMPPLKRLLSCNIERNDNDRDIKGTAPVESEPFETMESVQISEIDDYLNAVLKRCSKSHAHSGINFMESPRSSNI